MNTTTNEADQAMGWLLGRRSIRTYHRGELDETTITRLLEAAMAAPSAAAKDPWRFVVVRSRSKLEQMACVLSGGEMLLLAGTGIAICGDLKAAHDSQLSYLLQDCAAATENLLLCAHAQGLGACWLGVHPREQRMAAMKRILSLPEAIVPVACVSVGHPAEQKAARTRYAREYVHWDNW
ncbi:MAG TPA: nitroreductase family protein [Verrucomicrobiae bacterium]